MTPVAVPIVSKKSVSMIVKITSSAVHTPSFSNGSVRLNWPSVAKLGVTAKESRELRDAGRDRDDRR